MKPIDFVQGSPLGEKKVMAEDLNKCRDDPGKVTS